MNTNKSHKAIETSISCFDAVNKIEAYKNISIVIEIITLYVYVPPRFYTAHSCIRRNIARSYFLV